MIEETVLIRWSEPLSTTEEDRCQRAERMVRDATSGSNIYNGSRLTIIPKGSYKNNTNVRQESDVDITLVCEGSFYYKLPQGFTLAQLDIVPATIDFDKLISDTLTALNKKFGSGNVTRKSKCINIKDNTCRVSCDVTPTFRRRLYISQNHWHEGVCFFDTSGNFIENYPEQHYTNGISKNNRTNYYYKKIVRILKKINLEIPNRGLGNHSISSFLIESLTWNTPDSIFLADTNYTEKAKATIAHIYQSIDNNTASSWNEVSAILPLFSPERKWTTSDAKKWTELSWNLLT